MAARLGVSEWTLYQLVDRGEIPHLRVGRSIRFDPEEVRAHFSRRAAEPVG